MAAATVSVRVRKRGPYMDANDAETHSFGVIVMKEASSRSIRYRFSLMLLTLMGAGQYRWRTVAYTSDYFMWLSLF